MTTDQMDAEWVMPAEIVDRYWNMIPALIDPRCEPEPGTSTAHVKWMLSELRQMKDFGKAMRWLGFVQANLIGKRYTTVPVERDFTRPFFSAAPQAPHTPCSSEEAAQRQPVSVWGARDDETSISGEMIQPNLQGEGL